MDDNKMYIGTVNGVGRTLIIGNALKDIIKEQTGMIIINDPKIDSNALKESNDKLLQGEIFEQFKPIVEPKMAMTIPGVEYKNCLTCSLELNCKSKGRLKLFTEIAERKFRDSGLQDSVNVKIQCLKYQNKFMNRER
jgi:hypothetical protein